MKDKHEMKGGMMMSDKEMKAKMAVPKTKMPERMGKKKKRMSSGGSMYA